MAKLPVIEHPRVLIGVSGADDAGVYLLSDGLALVQTVDFFTPVVDDPYEFGRIAAANALSDIYAMGATPITALNIIAFPEYGDLGLDVLAEILRGGQDKCAEAGVAIIGGHSIDDKEPKYGLAITGTVDPKAMWTKGGAKPGDVLILTKPLGTGILSTAIKYGDATSAQIDSVIQTAQTLNKDAARIAGKYGIHAATDITGFGLINHLLDICTASGVGAVVSASALPVLSGVRELIEKQVIPGGTMKNLDHAGQALITELPKIDQIIAADAQTSGGLLLCAPKDNARQLQRELEDFGTPASAIIGEIVESLTPSLTLIE